MAGVILENTAGGLVHPDHLEGRSIWRDPEVQDLINRLHFGDPLLGWEGDERLALYRAPGRRWELWRLESDGEYRLIMKSKPGVHLDNRLIMHLVAHDTRRGYNPGQSVLVANEKLLSNIQKEGSARVQQAADKVYSALKKDFGAKLDGTLDAYM